MLFAGGAVVARNVVETLTAVVFNAAVVVAVVVVVAHAVDTANVVVTVVMVIVATTVGVHARGTKSRLGPVSMQSGRFAPPPTLAVGRMLRP